MTKRYYRYWATEVNQCQELRNKALFFRRRWQLRKQRLCLQALRKVTFKLTKLAILSMKTEKLMKLSKKHFVLHAWKNHAKEAYLEKRRVMFMVFKELKIHTVASLRLSNKVAQSARVKMASKVFDKWRTYSVTARIVKDFRQRQDLNTL